MSKHSINISGKYTFYVEADYTNVDEMIQETISHNEKLLIKVFMSKEKTEPIQFNSKWFKIQNNQTNLIDNKEPFYNLTINDIGLKNILNFFYIYNSKYAIFDFCNYSSQIFNFSKGVI